MSVGRMSFIAYRCRTLRLCCSYAVFKTVSKIARPRVRGRLFRAATTSPYIWPMGGRGGRPPGPLMPGSANASLGWRLSALRQRQSYNPNFPFSLDVSKLALLLIMGACTPKNIFSFQNLFVFFLDFVVRFIYSILFFTFLSISSLFPSPVALLSCFVLFS